MRKMTGSEIRKTWIAFFESKGHRFMPGVNLIPQNDKSLLWVNAGVTGLKKYFDGSEIPPCRRIVNVQKSIRTNDIENVGHTARHHTFFEMLGNFSIGDYFRKEVIAWAFEILTSEKWFGMEKDRLYMTYNPEDKASFEYWKEQGVSEDHLIPLEGNYWQIGEGPCGPNTEVFYDRGEKYDPEHLGDCLLREDRENDRYIEIWGIVFSQFNAVNGVERKDYKELPSKNIDTGAGLERIACIMQGTETNFETDLFSPIVKATMELCHKPYEGENLLSYRVIADHARALTFALSDGAYFSNEGRGYVLRRIIRRAMRYGKKLGIEKPFMYELIDVVASSYSDFYPELKEKAPFVKKMVLGEEEKFLKTLTSGESLLRDMISGKKLLEGKNAFRLYDTFGFPLDLTKEICKEAGVSIDEEGFTLEMEAQKKRARDARGEVDSFHKQSKDLLDFKTPSTFTYEKEELEAEVIGIFRDGVKVDSIEEEGDVAFDVTPFYAESGGQVSDEGVIENASFSAEVTAVSKAPCGQHLHHIHVRYGKLSLGDKVKLTINKTKRALTARNHSATHLLHAAISEVLGYHVDQKGSFVNEEYLRFDFSSFNKIDEESLQKIEDLVNEKIAEGIEEITEVLPIEEAKKIGAEMEFSEKYGDTVRVVEFGDFSKEFCGGTHVSNSSEIGIFVLESEGSVASGIRRIQGRTSLEGYRYLRNKKKSLSRISNLLGGASDADLPSRIEDLKQKDIDLNKEIVSLKQKMASSSAKDLEREFEEINGIHFFAKKFDLPRNDLMRLGDNLKTVHPDCLLILAGKENDKYPLVAFSSGKGKEFGAGKAMKLLSSILGGNGGGKPEMASGSSSSLDQFEKAIEEIKKSL